MKKSIGYIIYIIFVTLFSNCAGSPQNQLLSNKPQNESSSQPEVLSSSQPESFYDIGKNFTPSGYMGCTEKINLNPAFKVSPHSEPFCFKIEFLSSCSSGWAGLYWLNKPDNWGENPGTNLSDKGFTKITFWAKGDKGNETIKFGSGGIDNMSKDSKTFKYRDSYTGEDADINKKITLTDQWQQYELDIREQNLSSVIGGFFWSADWRENPTGITLFLDDIRFE